MEISHSGKIPESVSIELPGSKSLSNRFLIINALANQKAELKGLSEARDTMLLHEALSNSKEEHYFADGATPFRFFLAFAASKKKPTTLTGDAGLIKRSMLPLTEALTAMGAEIEFQGKIGFPPIAIKSGIKEFKNIQIERSISSQFVSALMLVAPVFPGEKTIELSGTESSNSYIIMTANCMKICRVNVAVLNNKITIPDSKYSVPAAITIEPDWSSAAWFYMLCAALPGSSFLLHNLNLQSSQGDSALPDLFLNFGVETKQIKNEIFISLTNQQIPNQPFNLINNIDLAPAIICTCAFLGIKASFSGLQTLVHKESNRIEAINTNLAQFGYQLIPHNDAWILESTEITNPQNPKHIRTFNDHRIAMAFSIFALKHSLTIDNPDCVVKSFPGFWEQWQKCNFVLKNHGK